jgi:NAD(P)-dependent dehydrogenase (short-subunit alcohol dehydrogenase family)
MNQNVFVVLAATSGIGSALCRRLKAAGAAVVPVARDARKLAPLAQELGEEGLLYDAASAEQVEAAVEQARARHGRIDGLASCAGSLLLKPAHLTAESEWRAVLDANLTSAFLAVRAGAKAMMQSGGSIALISSAAARTGLANHEAIAAAKAGVIGLTLAAAASYAARGIRVNCVAPGLVDTPLTSRITSSEKALEASRAMHALGRIGRPGDVAAALAWLLDPAQNWVTGQVLGVDGGLGSIRPR